MCALWLCDQVIQALAHVGEKLDLVHNSADPWDALIRGFVQQQKQLSDAWYHVKYSESSFIPILGKYRYPRECDDTVGGCGGSWSLSQVGVPDTCRQQGRQSDQHLFAQHFGCTYMAVGLLPCPLLRCFLLASCIPLLLNQVTSGAWRLWLYC